MEKVRYKYEVSKIAPSVHGYNYNVKEKISTNGGKTYYYTGYGHFCRTLKEALTIAIKGKHPKEER